MSGTVVKLKILIYVFIFLLISGFAGAESPAIIDAAGAANENTVKAILAADPKSVNVLYRDSTPLNTAILAGRTNIAFILIAHGADVNLSGSDGLTPLDWAYKSGNWPIAKKLLEHGGEASMDEHSVPILVAIRAGKIDEVKAILLREPKQIYARDGMGETTFHWAAHLCHKELLSLLWKEEGTDFFRDTTAFFRTALHFAAYSGCLPAATILLINGADVNAKDSLRHGPIT